MEESGIEVTTFLKSVAALPCERESRLPLTNRVMRLEVSQSRQTILYVRYGFLLVCYSNFIPIRPPSVWPHLFCGADCWS